MQRVVFGAEGVTAPVPHAHGFTEHPEQHPAFAGVHAHGVRPVSEHVDVVVHRDAAERVDHVQLVAFDVADDPAPSKVRRRRIVAARCDCARS